MKNKNVLLIVIAFVAITSAISCSPCCSTCGCAGTVSPQYPQSVVRKTHEKIVVGGATFHDGYLFACLVNGFGDVRDINGNHPIHMPCTDPLIKQRLDPNQGGWNFACQGACRVGGSCDAIVLVYDDDGTLVNHPDYPKTVGNWVLDEFLGDDQHFVKLIDKAKLPKVDISFNLPVSIQSLRELQKDTINEFIGPKEIIFTFTK